MPKTKSPGRWGDKGAGGWCVDGATGGGRHECTQQETTSTGGPGKRLRQCGTLYLRWQRSPGQRIAHTHTCSTNSTACGGDHAPIPTGPGTLGMPCAGHSIPSVVRDTGFPAHARGTLHHAPVGHLSTPAVAVCHNPAPLLRLHHCQGPLLPRAHCRRRGAQQQLPLPLLLLPRLLLLAGRRAGHHKAKAHVLAGGKSPAGE